VPACKLAGPYTNVWADGQFSERLAYTTLHDWGLIIARTGGALVHLNGQSWGIYTIVEEVDATLLANRGMQVILIQENWFDGTEKYSGIVAGTASIGSTQPLNDLANAALLCQQRGCDVEAARAIVSKYTDEESFLDGFLSNRVFNNYDDFTCFYANGQVLFNHNFYLFVDSRTQKVKLITMDYSETFVKVPQFDGDTWILPPWFYMPTAAERSYLCNVTKSNMPFVHFTCDPVGYVMSLAWGDYFFDYIQKYVGALQSPLEHANDYVSLWTKQYNEALAQVQVAGGIQANNRFTTRHPLQMYSAAITELLICRNSNANRAWSPSLFSYARCTGTTTAIASASPVFSPNLALFCCIVYTLVCTVVCAVACSWCANRGPKANYVRF